MSSKTTYVWISIFFTVLLITFMGIFYYMYSKATYSFSNYDYTKNSYLVNDSSNGLQILNTGSAYTSTTTQKNKETMISNAFDKLNTFGVTDTTIALETTKNINLSLLFIILFIFTLLFGFAITFYFYKKIDK